MGGSMRSGLLIGVLLLFVSPPSAAVDIRGSAIVFGSTTDNRGLESDNLEQKYNVDLFQRVSPYLSLRFGYSYYDFNTQFQAGTDFSRFSQIPRFDILYQRPKFTANLSWTQQDTGSTVSDFESNSLRASLGWRPLDNLRLALNLRDERNVVDEAVFGRETENRFVDFSVGYDRTHWNTSYSYRRNLVENVVSDLRSDQHRHEFQLNGGRKFHQDRLRLSFASSLSDIQRKTRIGEDAEPAEPIPPRQGLFAVDTSPEIGELDPNPGLIDGDRVTPAPPGIDIGGANTFRNIGVDLGLTIQTTRLEIYVASPSGPGLVWQVFHSRDNLVWEGLEGVTSEWDSTRLRYTLRFPRIVDRFFKAVNLSVNANPEVLVTEVRALIDVNVQPGESAFDTTFYRISGGADWRPHSRVRARVNLGINTDDQVSDGFVRRDFTGKSAQAGLGFDLTRHLNLDFNYNYDDTENLSPPILLRTNISYGTRLTWTPLPTVDAVLSAQQREESEKGLLLQSNRNLRLLVSTDLLPDLRLVSDLFTDRLEDPFSGFDRDTYGIRESLIATPWRRWTLTGRVAWELFETSEGDPLRDRVQLDLNTVWNATAFWSLSGIWSWVDNDGQANLRQIYNVAYTPGPKLSLSGSYQNFETADRRVTANAAISATYRLNRYFLLSGNISRSRIDEAAGIVAEISSARLGFQLSF